MQTTNANPAKRVSLNAIFTDQKKSAAKQKKELREQHKVERLELKDRQKGQMLDLIEAQKTQVQKITDTLFEILGKTERLERPNPSAKTVTIPVSSKKVAANKK